MITSLRCTVHWLWYDLWVGIYIDVKHQAIYIAPLPTLVICLYLKKGESRNK